jgi:WD40 repeat protein
MATASEDKTVRIWTLKTNHQPLKISDKNPLIIENESSVYSVAFSPNDQLIAIGGQNKMVDLWDIKGKLIKKFEGHESPIWGVVFNPNPKNKIIASASDDKTVRLWDWDRRTPIVTLKGHQDEVNDVSFSKSGRILASASSDKTVILWDVEQVTDLDKLLEGGCSWLKNYFTFNDPNKNKQLCPAPKG